MSARMPLWPLRRETLTFLTFRLATRPLHVILNLVQDNRLRFAVRVILKRVQDDVDSQDDVFGEDDVTLITLTTSPCVLLRRPESWRCGECLRHIRPPTSS